MQSPLGESIITQMGPLDIDLSLLVILALLRSTLRF